VFTGFVLIDDYRHVGLKMMVVVQKTLQEKMGTKEKTREVIGNNNNPK
jgi:hypothetical protein